MFRFLGVPAMVGRTLLPDDARSGAPAVFVMSYKLWFKQPQPGPLIVGKTFVLNGVPTTLVGIMPPRFTKLGADLWKSVALSRADPEMSEGLLEFSGQIEARRHHRAGAGRYRHPGPPAGQSLPEELPRQVQHPDRFLAGQSGGAVPEDAVHSWGGGRVAAAHRVRERSEYAVGPCYGT